MEIYETEHFGDSCTDNINLANNPEIKQHSSTHGSDTDSFVIPATIPPNSSSFSDAPQSSSTKRKKKESNKYFEIELLKLEEQKLTALLQSNINPVNHDDEDMLFLKSLYPYFHTMNPLQKLRIRNQLQAVLLMIYPPTYISHKKYMLKI